MINSLTFGGEKIVWRSIEDLCGFDTEKCYYLAFCWCRRELKSFEDLTCEAIIDCIEWVDTLDLSNVNVIMPDGFETDPIFTAWLQATPPLYSFTETDPVFSQWLIDTPPLYAETDPVFSQWLIDTPPLYTFTESDPVFSQRLIDTPPLYSETDPVFSAWLIINPTHGNNTWDQDLTDFIEIDSVSTLTNKRIQPRVFPQVTANSLIPEIATYDIYTITALAHDLTINNQSISAPSDWEKIEIRLYDDGTPRNITWASDYVAKAWTPLPAVTVPTKHMAMYLEWNANLTKRNLMSVRQES